ncbi:hypothetical protein DCAR_0830569 [Daucus carota subsp. sativus]|uniref:Uncharacterized protein n=1 Tax=Daucus carota subsp. sativus TaxID=79200 RepID=A0AAF1B9D4_DAUCS|nr:hypothetical protein DCAR_0830569 [Daucus carota subsp. sativus]
MAVKCGCGALAEQHTAWTTANAGRCFVAYPPLCDRARVIIPGLVRRINALEAETQYFETLKGTLYEERYADVEKRKNGGCSSVLLLLIVTWEQLV